MHVTLYCTWRPSGLATALHGQAGDIGIHREMSKLLKPFTDAQRDVKESLIGERRLVKEKLPAITFPQLQAIAAPPEIDEDDDEDEDVIRVGKIAHQYLSEYASKQNVDKTLGIYKNPIDERYYIGNTPIEIRDNNLIIGEQEYEGTPGLYELIISKKPDKHSYTHQDLDNCAKILVYTSALKQNNDPDEARLNERTYNVFSGTLNPAQSQSQTSRGWKWKTNSEKNLDRQKPV